MKQVCGIAVKTDKHELIMVVVVLPVLELYYKSLQKLLFFFIFYQYCWLWFLDCFVMLHVLSCLISLSLCLFSLKVYKLLLVNISN